MRAVIIEREGAWQVRGVAGDELPSKFSETILLWVSHNEESAVEKCKKYDDYNILTYRTRNNDDL